MIKVALRHVGGSLPGIPARNLTKEEVERYGGEDYLLSTNQYVKPMSNKAHFGGKENKSEVDE